MTGADKARIEKGINAAISRSRKKKSGQPKSELYHPLYNNYSYGKNVRGNRNVDYDILRRISKKAWLINTIIGHIADKVIPYMVPLSYEGRRGFDIILKDRDKKATEADQKKAKEIQQYFLKTGWKPDPDREDSLVDYVKKILRDLYTLDQVACEVQWTRGGTPFAFWAIDGASISRCNEDGYNGDDKIRYVQEVDGVTTAIYTQKEMIFQFANPRTDIRHAGYGYSKVEQAIDLVVSLINSFAFNAGAFTDDKLPRGMLLLNGDAGFEEVEMIEEYLVDVMSAPVTALGKWTIPIIPSGSGDGKSKLEWVSMNSSAQEMQFSRWQDTLYMSIGALFGIDVESIGIKSENSAKLIESGSMQARRYSDDKGIGSALTFLQSHFQKQLDWIDDRFMIQFYGFEQDDAKETRDTIESQLKTFKSVNDILKENDMPTSKEPWADIPGIMSPQIQQLYSAKVAAEAQAQMGGEEPEMGEDEFGGEPTEDFSEEDIFGKSIKNTIPEEITITI